MQSLPIRGRVVTAVGVALALLAAMPPALASAAPGTGAPARTATADAVHQPVSRTVTLLTGDVVTVNTAADGTVTRSVRNPQGAMSGFSTQTSDGHTYIYPVSALPYVASGQLDRGLFDITRLLADGYDDSQTDHLPLIVKYTDSAARSRTPIAPPKGAVKTLTLSSIQGAALSQKRADAAGFWSALTGGGTAATGRGTAATPRLGGGIAKIWLDGKARAALEDTTAQIGAPQVWAGGNLGQGVNVAVLDTGIDTQHPDLADRIAASRSFVPDQDIEDWNGHGTHVASTIAGTGAASDGKERGVAPGAGLYVGKVLGPDGAGQESWVLAGMEWAARTQHAKVISMSLGAGPSDGSDPMSQAVNELSAETGALFTIAAGNAGRSTVSAPGVADAALSVGAVDTSDQLADFSSTGPRLGDHGLKPELTAPGVDVLAARAQHALDGEGLYQTMSGTSMATPHVAGAAALLAKAHPDWTGQQLKDALVSTTKLTPEYDPYLAGSGRLDVAAAVKDTVFATGSVFGGSHDYPTPAGAKSEKEVTYTNTADQPVTLNLAVAPSAGTSAEAFSLSAQQVTVPANGSSTVTLITAYDAVQTEAMTSGQILATDASGTLVAHTIIGAYEDSEHYDLTVTAKDRSGKPLADRVLVTDGHTYEVMYTDAETGTSSVSLTPGSYTLFMVADVEGAHGPHSKGMVLLSAPDIDVSKDTSVILDARSAKQVSVRTPQPTTPAAIRFDVDRTWDSGHAYGLSMLPNASYDSIWALPVSKEITQGTFEFGSSWRLEEPTLTVSSRTRTFDDLRVRRGAKPLSEGNHRYDAVYAGEGAAGDYAKLDARGKTSVVRRSDLVSAEDQAAAAAAAGATLLLIINDGAGRLTPWDEEIAVPLPAPPVTVATLTADEGAELIAQLRAGKQSLQVTSSPTTDYVYDVAHHMHGIAEDLTYQPRQSDLARVDVSFRNNQPGIGMEMRTDVWKGIAAANALRTPVQGERTDWVSADKDWDEVASIGTELMITNDGWKHYEAGTTSSLEYFGPIQRPRMSTYNRAVRYGDFFDVLVPTWTDSQAGHIGTTPTNGDVRSTMKLYQGDTLVASNPWYRLQVPTLAPERLPYRLVSENSRGKWKNDYSTTTRTEWGFTSGRPADGELELPPLVQLDYTVEGIDASGKTKRHADLAVTPAHLQGGPSSDTIQKVSLEVSYDDGATWHRAPLSHTDQGWSTRLDAPAGAQFVTLRASASDTQGNSVVQDITRAFGLK